MTTTPQNAPIYDELTERKGGICKIPEKNSKYKTAIQHAKGELAGFSRIAGDISSDVRRAIIDLIIDEAVRRGHSMRDIAYILLIARLESGFNPDAAACGSSASGVMQITDITAKDLANVTTEPEWRKKNPQDSDIHITDAADRFNARKNIIAGIIQYERCKARAILALQSTKQSIYEPRIYQYYHAGLYFDAKKPPNPRQTPDLSKVDSYGFGKFKEQILPFLDAVEAALKKIGKFQVKLTQPDGKPYGGVEYVAFVPRTWAEATDKIFGWAANLFKKSSAKDEKANDKANAAATPAPTAGAASTPPSASAPPAASTEKPISYPGRIKDGVKFDVIQGRTDSEGKTAEIAVKGVAEVYMCILEYDYDNKAANLQQQREENKGGQSEGSGDGSTSSEISVGGNTETSASAASSKGTKENNHGEEDDALNVGLIEQYSPRQWSAMYCDRRPKIEKIAEGFRKIGKPFETELLEFSRSYIAKPSAAIDAAAPTNAEPSMPVQVEHISASLKKEQAKESSKPVAVITTKPDNPNTVTQGKASTPWMDIALSERFQQKVSGVAESSPEWKKLQGEITEKKSENKSLTQEINAERRKAAKQRDEGKISNLKTKIDRNNSDIETILQKLVAIEKDGSFNNPRIIEYFYATGIPEIKHARGEAVNDEENWCAAFVSWCLDKAGYKILPKSSAARAIEWINYGEEAKEGTYGAIVVVERQKKNAAGARTTSGRHVGFLIKEEKNNAGEDVVLVLGGNQTYDVINKSSTPNIGRVTVTEFKKKEWTVSARRIPRKEDKK